MSGIRDACRAAVAVLVLAGVAPPAAEGRDRRAKELTYTGTKEWVVYRIREDADGKIIKEVLADADTQEEADELRDLARKQGSDSVTDPWDYYTERRTRERLPGKRIPVEPDVPPPSTTKPGGPGKVRPQAEAGPDVVGTWAGTYQSSRGLPFETTIEFKADGTVTSTTPSGRGGRGTWVLRGKAVEVRWSNGATATWPVRDNRIESRTEGDGFWESITLEKR